MTSSLDVIVLNIALKSSNYWNCLLSLENKTKFDVIATSVSDTQPHGQ